MYPNNQLTNFKFEKILFKDINRYTTSLFGSIDDKPAIVILQKLPWNDSSREYFFENILSYEIKISNGKWLSLLCSCKDNITSNIICPASEEDIIKYSFEETIIISETIDYYNKYSIFYIKESILNNKPDLSWIDRILNGENEQDRILFNDQDFVFMKGFKWLSDNTEDFSGLVIVRNKELRSLRDINENHIDLLEKIKAIVTETMQDKYNLSYNKLRIYVHYQPTFYHFHIHINIITNPQGWDAGRCHMLDNVISNIKINPNYYQLCTLNFEVSINSLFLKKVKSLTL